MHANFQLLGTSRDELLDIRLERRCTAANNVMCNMEEKASRGKFELKQFQLVTSNNLVHSELGAKKNCQFSEPL